jgi:hypothetical protein
LRKGTDAQIKTPTIDAVLDLAALKTPPGEYTMTFLGSYVVKYRADLDGAKLAQAEQKKGDETAGTAAKQGTVGKPVKAATDLAAPKETVDIVVSEPIRIRVKPADAK